MASRVSHATVPSSSWNVLELPQNRFGLGGIRLGNFVSRKLAEQNKEFKLQYDPLTRRITVLNTTDLPPSVLHKMLYTQSAVRKYDAWVRYPVIEKGSNGERNLEIQFSWRKPSTIQPETRPEPRSTPDGSAKIGPPFTQPETSAKHSRATANHSIGCLVDLNIQDYKVPVAAFATPKETPIYTETVKGKSHVFLSQAPGCLVKKVDLDRAFGSYAVFFHFTQSQDAEAVLQQACRKIPREYIKGTYLPNIMSYSSVLRVSVDKLRDISPDAVKPIMDIIYEAIKAGQPSFGAITAGIDKWMQDNGILLSGLSLSSHQLQDSEKDADVPTIRQSTPRAQNIEDRNMLKIDDTAIKHLKFYETMVSETYEDSGPSILSDGMVHVTYTTGTFAIAFNSEIDARSFLNLLSKGVYKDCIRLTSDNKLQVEGRYDGSRQLAGESRKYAKAAIQLLCERTPKFKNEIERFAKATMQID